MTQGRCRPADTPSTHTLLLSHEHLRSPAVGLGLGSSWHLQLYGGTPTCWDGGHCTSSERRIQQGAPPLLPQTLVLLLACETVRVRVEEEAG